MDISWIFEAGQQYDALNNKHDKGYKFLLSSKRVFVELLRSFVKQGWVNKIDESNVVQIDKSFILQDFNEKEADIVYKVKLDDNEVIFYILLELQSTVDFQMPYRLLLYMVEIWRTIIKDEPKHLIERKDYKLPAIIPIVLYNGENNWTACREYKEYLHGNELFEEYILNFRYILIDVNRFDEDELLKLQNLIGSVFLLDQKGNAETTIEKLKKLAGALQKLNKEDSQLFKAWVVRVLSMGMSEQHQERIRKIIEENEEAESMVYNLQRVAIELRMQGIEEGIKKGIKEGKKEGKIEGKISTLLRQLSKKFGILPQEISDRISSIKDLDTIDKMLDDIFDIESLEEVEEYLNN